MSSQKAIVVVIYLMAIGVILYVLNATFGRSMDVMRTSFTGITANITTGNATMVSASWGTVLTDQLAGWDIFFASFIIVFIAVGVWAIASTFIHTRYDRPGGGMQ